MTGTLLLFPRLGLQFLLVHFGTCNGRGAGLHIELKIPKAGILASMRISYAALSVL